MFKKFTTPQIKNALRLDMNIRSKPFPFWKFLIFDNSLKTPTTMFCNKFLGKTCHFITNKIIQNPYESIVFSLLLMLLIKCQIIFSILILITKEVLLYVLIYSIKTFQWNSLINSFCKFIVQFKRTQIINQNRFVINSAQCRSHHLFGNIIKGKF